MNEEDLTFLLYRLDRLEEPKSIANKASPSIDRDCFVLMDTARRILSPKDSFYKFFWLVMQAGLRTIIAERKSENRRFA